MLMSMCSPSSSGSSDVVGVDSTMLPRSSVPSATRRGRPCASRPLVESSTSTVRFVVAMLFPHLLALAQATLHVGRQVVKSRGDRKLVHRIPRFRIGGERLPELLGP